MRKLPHGAVTTTWPQGCYGPTWQIQCIVHGARVQNPYCQITTIVGDNMPTGVTGASTMVGSQRVIYIHSSLYGHHWAFFRFVLAHECGHHMLGHLAQDQLTHWEKEVQADCWAARALAQAGEFQTISALIQYIHSNANPVQPQTHQAPPIGYLQSRDAPGFSGSSERALAKNDRALLVHSFRSALALLCAHPMAGLLAGFALRAPVRFAVAPVKWGAIRTHVDHEAERLLRA